MLVFLVVVFAVLAVALSDSTANILVVTEYASSTCSGSFNAANAVVLGSCFPYLSGSTLIGVIATATQSVDGTTITATQAHYATSTCSGSAVSSSSTTYSTTCSSGASAAIMASNQHPTLPGPGALYTYYSDVGCTMPLWMRWRAVGGVCATNVLGATTNYVMDQCFANNNTIVEHTFSASTCSPSSLQSTAVHADGACMSNSANRNVLGAYLTTQCTFLPPTAAPSMPPVNAPTHPPASPPTPHHHHNPTPKPTTHHHHPPTHHGNAGGRGGRGGYAAAVTGFLANVGQWFANAVGAYM